MCGEGGVGNVVEKMSDSDKTVVCQWWAVQAGGRVGEIPERRRDVCVKNQEPSKRVWKALKRGPGRGLSE